MEVCMKTSAIQTNKRVNSGGLAVGESAAGIEPLEHLATVKGLVDSAALATRKEAWRMPTGALPTECQ